MKKSCTVKYTKAINRYKKVSNIVQVIDNLSESLQKKNPIKQTF